MRCFGRASTHYAPPPPPPPPAPEFTVACPNPSSRCAGHMQRAVSVGEAIRLFQWKRMHQTWSSVESGAAAVCLKKGLTNSGGSERFLTQPHANASDAAAKIRGITSASCPEREPGATPIETVTDLGDSTQVRFACARQVQLHESELLLAHRVEPVQDVSVQTHSRKPELELTGQRLYATLRLHGACPHKHAMVNLEGPHALAQSCWWSRILHLAAS